MKSAILKCAAVLILLATVALSGCGGASGVSATPPPAPPPPPQPLAISSSAPPNGSVRTAYGGSGFPLGASGGVQPYAWSWAPASGSTLPPGLGLSASGLISGTPTTAGSYNVSVTVTDSETPSARASASYSITIVASGQLVITSGPPPNGTVNQTYGGSFSITENHCLATFTGWQPSAAGGTGNLSWSWSAAPGSSLPQGLGIGVESYTCGGSTRCCVTVTSPPLIHGTPTTAGTYHVIVTFTDSASPPAQASANYTIAINGATAAAAAKATAQVPSAQQFPHYKLLDLGTFGGPRSYLNIPDASYAPVLTNDNAVAGWADTLISDPYPNLCFNLDCFVSKAFRWQDGTQTELKGLAEGLSSQANWIAENGMIVGISQNGLIDPLFPGFPQTHAVLWERGEAIDLGTMGGGNETAALAVNSKRQVVGAAANDVPDPAAIFGLNFGWITQTRAFLWQNGVMQDLGTLGGTDAVALLVNERGQIAGDSYTSLAPSPYCATATFGGLSLTTGAFLWEDGQMKNLGNLGGTCTLTFDLNNRGQVIGLSTLPGDVAQHPFLWDRGVLTDLGTLGGSNGNAIAINDVGEITGFANEQGDQTVHAFLWKGGTTTDLGTVAGDSCSAGFSINARGQVVGISAPCDFSQIRAFLWERGAIADLNTLIPSGSALSLTVPATINDRGEIAGLGVPIGCDNVDVCGHALVLIPCDDAHPGIEGCDYTSVDASAATSLAIPKPVAQRPESANPGLPGAAGPMMRALRARRLPWYRDLGAQPPK